MGEITIKKALDDYRTVYMPYRNFADRTREEYLNDLKGFATFLEQSGISQIQGIGLPIIQRYAAQLENKGFSSRTRKRKIVTIRLFLSFLFQQGYIENNIATNVILPFLEDRIPYVLTQKECNRLRGVCAKNTRDRAIIELLLQTGIKLSELLHLTMDDIEIGDKQNGYMRIQASRGKKERIVPLNTKAAGALSDYLNERNGKEYGILFVNRFGESLGERGVQKMLKKYLEKAGIAGASIQTLRHTFGAQHLAKGTSPKTVQDVMGLKDARSTAIYHTLAKKIVSRELEEHAL